MGLSSRNWAKTGGRDAWTPRTQIQSLAAVTSAERWTKVVGARGSLTAEGKAPSAGVNIWVKRLKSPVDVTSSGLSHVEARKRSKELLRLPSYSRDRVLPHQSLLLTVYPSPTITVNSHTHAHHHGCGLALPCKSWRCRGSVSRKLCPHPRASSCTYFASRLHANSICSLSLAHTLPPLWASVESQNSIPTGSLSLSYSLNNFGSWFVIFWARVFSLQRPPFGRWGLI